MPSQIWIFLSELPLAILDPSGEKDTEFTLLVCPVKVEIISPVSPFQILIVLSQPLAILDPSGEKDTEFTRSLFPVIIEIISTVSPFQILIV